MSTVIFYPQSGDRELCRLYGDDGDREMILREIDGWYGTPESRTEATPRKWGDGDHDVSGADIAYGARTVPIAYRLLAGDRARLEQLRSMLDALTHRLVRLRVVDTPEDTYQVGEVLQVLPDKAPQNMAMQTDTGLITVLCRRPERLSWRSTDVQLFPTSSSSGGLSYGGKGLGLVYPLSYGADAGSPQSVALLRNRGSATAYPVITVTGPMPDGVALLGSDGRSVQWSGSVGRVPLILDCRTQTASMGGVDVSRRLTRRGFPAIPAMGSLSVQLMSPGDGWATVSVRDTYL